LLDLLKSRQDPSPHKLLICRQLNSWLRMMAQVGSRWIFSIPHMTISPHLCILSIPCPAPCGTGNTSYGWFAQLAFATGSSWGGRVEVVLKNEKVMGCSMCGWVLGHPRKETPPYILPCVNNCDDPHSTLVFNIVWVWRCGQGLHCIFSGKRLRRQPYDSSHTVSNQRPET